MDDEVQLIFSRLHSPSVQRAQMHHEDGYAL